MMAWMFPHLGRFSAYLFGNSWMGILAMIRCSSWFQPTFTEFVGKLPRSFKSGLAHAYNKSPAQSYFEIRNSKTFIEAHKRILSIARGQIDVSKAPLAVTPADRLQVNCNTTNSLYLLFESISDHTMTASSAN